MKQNAVWGQLALVAGILTAFCMTALFTTCNTNVRNAPYIAVSVMFAILCAVMLGLAVWNRLKQGKGKLALPIDKAFLLVAIVFIAIRLAQFDTLPRWDSETYFAALRKACLPGLRRLRPLYPRGTEVQTRKDWKLFQTMMKTIGPRLTLWMASRR